MNVPEMRGRCPHCGKEMKGYRETQIFLGSPFRSCTKCKGIYLDRRYHEIEIDEVENEAEISVSKLIRQTIVSLIFFGVALLLNLGALSVGYIHVGGLMLLVIALALMLQGLIDIIMVKIGAKEKQLEKERLESQKRLENPEYARTLAELGYSVPERYL